MPYEIGAKIWVRGDRVTITTEPYSLHGVEWQDGTDAAGKVLTVPTPEAKAARLAATRAEYRGMQDGFRRLK